ncbi:hypothetical protein LSH36_19g10003 [Paralvinella palmiformis]|uniref:E3 ubiquitin-protein ligase CHFR n=1 Tax=Paralvinella palmiformis TaxID=53620 RepID=A0AAD9KBE8_9ANNE|nr:hypothetical protein LSH36_19g10003 [Paralvinella palmiformis]
MAEEGGGSVCCCLYRLSRVSGQEHPYVILDGKESVSLGRSDTCTVVLRESKAISRCHAVLDKRSEKQWTITDCKSGNGVYVNNTKIMPGRPRLLSDQEVIELGRDCQNTQAVYYRFQFFYKAKLALLNNVGSCTGLGLSMLNRSNKVSIKRHSLDLSPRGLLRDKMRKKESWLKENISDKLAEHEAKQVLSLLAESKTAVSKLEEQLQEHCVRELTLKSELQQHEQHEELLVERKSEYKRKFEDLEKIHSAKEMEFHDMLLARSAEKHRQEAVQQQNHHLLRIELEGEFHDREQEFRETVGEKLVCLKKEKQEMKQQLKASNTQEQELRSTITELQSHQLTARNMLDMAQREAQRLANIGQETKAEMTTILETVVESEFVCAICSELFIQATSLNCSHSFCRLCIDKWLTQKNECPACRQTVTSRVRSIVLDNYINRLMEILSDQTQAQRKISLVERQNEQKLWDKPAKSRRGRGQPSGAAAQAAHSGVRPTSRPVSHVPSQPTQEQLLHARGYMPLADFLQRIQHQSRHVVQSSTGFQEPTIQNMRAGHHHHPMHHNQLIGQYPGTYHGQNQPNFYNQVQHVINSRRNNTWVAQPFNWYSAAN